MPVLARPYLACDVIQRFRSDTCQRGLTQLPAFLVGCDQTLHHPYGGRPPVSSESAEIEMLVTLARGEPAPRTPDGANWGTPDAWLWDAQNGCHGCSTFDWRYVAAGFPYRVRPEVNHG